MGFEQGRAEQGCCDGPRKERLQRQDSVMDTDAVAQTIRAEMLASLRAQRKRTREALTSGEELDDSFRAHLERMMEFTGRYVKD